MKRYEYVVESIPLDEAHREDGMLAGLGEKGWHLSAVIDNERAREYYFARLIPSEAPS